jgi:hypothetical protein
MYTLNMIPKICSVDFLIYSVAHIIHLNNVVEPYFRLVTIFLKSIPNFKSNLELVVFSSPMTTRLKSHLNLKIDPKQEETKLNHYKHIEGSIFLPLLPNLQT